MRSGNHFAGMSCVLMPSQVVSEIKEVTIGLLVQFEDSGAAARIAIDDINAGKFPGLLNGINLTYIEAV